MISFSLCFLSQNGRNHQHLLHGHLGHHIKCSIVSVGKIVFVLAHLDGIQPLVHSAEAGEVWDAAVQEREMNTEGGHKQEPLVIMIIKSGRPNIIVNPDHLRMIQTRIITLHFQKARQNLENSTGLIHEPKFSKLILHKVYFPNEVIGFREPIYPLSVCGKSGPRSCTPPQMKVQTGIMEISKPWLSKETNTQSRNASKCFVLKIAQLLQSRFSPKAFVGRIWSIKPKGFNLHNRSAPGETRDTVFGKKWTVPWMALQQEYEFPVSRKRKAFTLRDNQMHNIVLDVIHINVKWC